MRQRLQRLIPLLCIAALAATSAPMGAQVRSPYNQGAAGLGQLLGRLQTTASAMHTGAHPDDEDSSLMATLARGEHARVAYLSASRGEGGQNVIGPELFEPLGVIRSEELLQARRLDGADQMFTRVFEFGFTKTREEAAQKWGQENLLCDMVRAIRLYRPMVVFSRFQGTGADGHGQHQLVGYITPVAYRAAGDPRQCTQHFAEGLRPWQPLKLYVSEGFRPPQSDAERPTLRIETGEYNPLLGRTYFEIAAEGRSQHKTQEMGTLELRGSQKSGVRLLDSKVQLPAQESSLFGGIDTSISGIARTVKLQEGIIDTELKAIEAAAAQARQQYDALAPGTTVPMLAEGLKQTRAARAKLAQRSDDAAQDAGFMLAIKEREFGEALQRAAGVVFDAVSDAETVAPGESFTVSLRIFAPADAGVDVSNIKLQLPEGWTAEPVQEPPAPSIFFRRFRETTPFSAFYKVTIPQSAPPTTPYWLQNPREGFLFDWPAGAPKNMPFNNPLVVGTADVKVNGTSIPATQAAQYRFADDIRGELRRNLAVVPAITLGVDPTLMIVSKSGQPLTRRVAVSVSNNAQGALSGSVKLNLPSGWKSSPPEAPFQFKQKGEKTAVSFTVTVPGGAAERQYQVEAEANAAGRSYSLAQQTIAYPHIQTHRLYAAAQAKVEVLDLKVAPVKVGYIMGSGDQVPQAIERMGIPVTMLEEKELATGDLAKYDTIVVGVRASQVRPDFVASHGRLLDFVRNGGTLIVQYQQQEYIREKLPPYPAEQEMIGTARARVTDETAPVKVLQPNNPAFTYPNRISEADWNDWVQERNLYSWTKWAPEYTPLLEAHDPGEAPQQGGALYAQIGKGKYVYSSYSWFRQLPAGVPGAYRLFANLLSLPKAPANGVQNARGAKASSVKVTDKATADATMRAAH